MNSRANLFRNYFFSGRRSLNTITYTEWLAEGGRDLSGEIDFLDNSGKARYILIKPDLFPEERLIFIVSGWSDKVRQSGLVGSRIEFDVMPQEIRPDGTAVAANVRFQDSAKAE